MPSNRTRVARAALRLSDAQVCFLLHGCNFTSGVKFPFASIAEGIAAWHAHRDDLLARVSDDPSPLSYLPGSKPAAWFWEQGLDAPNNQNEVTA